MEDLLGLQAQRDADRFGPVGWEVALHLQVAGAPVEPGLEGGREIFPVEPELVDGGEPDHPQLVQLEVAGVEEEVAAQPQELAEPDEGSLAPRDLDEAGEAVRQPDEVLEHAHAGGEVERLGAHLADRLGPEHVGARCDLLGQEGAEVVELLARERRHRHHPDGVALELVEESPVGLAGPVGLRLRLAQELLVRGRLPGLQEGAGDPRREEFVQVRGPDGEEPEPLHEREVRTPGLLEHPPVEAQPGEFLFDDHGPCPTQTGS